MTLSNFGENEKFCLAIISEFAAEMKKPKTLPYRQGFLNKKAWNFRKNTKAAAVLNEIARKKL